MLVELVTELTTSSRSELLSAVIVAARRPVGGSLTKAIIALARPSTQSKVSPPCNQHSTTEYSQPYADVAAMFEA
jgi:hypothetical protein